MPSGHNSRHGSISIRRQTEMLPLYLPSSLSSADGSPSTSPTKRDSPSSPSPPLLRQQPPYNTNTSAVRDRRISSSSSLSSRPRSNIFTSATGQHFVVPSVDEYTPNFSLSSSISSSDYSTSSATTRPRPHSSYFPAPVTTYSSPLTWGSPSKRRSETHRSVNSQINHNSNGDLIARLNRTSTPVYPTASTTSNTAPSAPSDQGDWQLAGGLVELAEKRWLGKSKVLSTLGGIRELRDKINSSHKVLEAKTTRIQQDHSKLISETREMCARIDIMLMQGREIRGKSEHQRKVIGQLRDNWKNISDNITARKNMANIADPVLASKNMGSMRPNVRGFDGGSSDGKTPPYRFPRPVQNRPPTPMSPLARFVSTADSNMVDNNNINNNFYDESRLTANDSEYMLVADDSSFTNGLRNSFANGVRDSITVDEQWYLRTSPISRMMLDVEPPAERNPRLSKMSSMPTMGHHRETSTSSVRSNNRQVSVYGSRFVYPGSLPDDIAELERDSSRGPDGFNDTLPLSDGAIIQERVESPLLPPPGVMVTPSTSAIEFSPFKNKEKRHESMDSYTLGIVSNVRMRRDSATLAVEMDGKSLYSIDGFAEKGVELNKMRKPPESPLDTPIEKDEGAFKENGSIKSSPLDEAEPGAQLPSTVDTEMVYASGKTAGGNRNSISPEMMGMLAEAMSGIPDTNGAREDACKPVNQADMNMQTDAPSTNLEDKAVIKGVPKPLKSLAFRSRQNERLQNQMDSIQRYLDDGEEPLHAPQAHSTEDNMSIYGVIYEEPDNQVDDNNNNSGYAPNDITPQTPRSFHHHHQQQQHARNPSNFGAFSSINTRQSNNNNSTTMPPTTMGNTNSRRGGMGCRYYTRYYENSHAPSRSGTGSTHASSTTRILKLNMPVPAPPNAHEKRRRRRRRYLPSLFKKLFRSRLEKLRMSLPIPPPPPSIEEENNNIININDISMTGVFTSRPSTSGGTGSKRSSWYRTHQRTKSDVETLTLIGLTDKNEARMAQMVKRHGGISAFANFVFNKASRFHSTGRFMGSASSRHSTSPYRFAGALGGNSVIGSIGGVLGSMADGADEVKPCLNCALKGRTCAVRQKAPIGKGELSCLTCRDNRQCMDFWHVGGGQYVAKAREPCFPEGLEGRFSAGSEEDLL